MKKTADAIITIILCGIICILIVFSTTSREGAKEGIELCENIIIPSLMPILIISNIIIKSKGRLVFDKAFGFIFEKVFRLPRCSAAAVILGLTCGYPAGAVLTSDLHKSGAITDNDAKRIMRFNLCGGAAFIITAVGTVTIGSTKTGVILFLINIIAALLTAFITSLFEKRMTKITNISNDFPLISDAVPDAVEAAIKSILNMSAYIILFSAASKIFSPPSSLMPLLEITDGICDTDKIPSLPYLAFFLSFGGLCIHLQLFGFLKQMKISYFDFLTHRMLCFIFTFSPKPLRCSAMSLPLFTISPRAELR